VTPKLFSQRNTASRIGRITNTRAVFSGSFRAIKRRYLVDFTKLVRRDQPIASLSKNRRAGQPVFYGFSSGIEPNTKAADHNPAKHFEASVSESCSALAMALASRADDVTDGLSRIRGAGVDDAAAEPGSLTQTGHFGPEINL
jgi:hypothetical protein